MNTRPSRSPWDAARSPGLDAVAAAAVLDDLSQAEFEALQWLVRLGEDCSTAERAGFDAWIEADPAHRDAFQACSADLAEVDAACAVMTSEDIAGLRARNVVDRLIEGRPVRAATPGGLGLGAVPAPFPTAVPAPRPDRSAGSRPAIRHPAAARRHPSALVATAVAVSALCGGWVAWHQWYYSPIFEHRFATQRGQQLDAALPDGSRVLLDTASIAEVTLYRNRREIRLPEGQLLLEVRSDAARPFEVLAGASRVTVTGTRFTVRHAPSVGNDSVEVAVLEGQVRVAPQASPPLPDAARPGRGRPGGEAHAAAAVMLGAGQVLVSDSEGVPGEVRTVPTVSIATWREQRIRFDDVPLAAVLAEIERYQPTGIRLQDAAVGQLTVTASVDLRNLAGFLRNLPVVLPVRFSKQADGSRLVSLRD